MDTYSETHRKHMAHEIDRQNREWKRLNVRRREDRYRHLYAVLMTALAVVLFLLHWRIK